MFQRMVNFINARKHRKETDFLTSKTVSQYADVNRLLDIDPNI